MTPAENKQTVEPWAVGFRYWAMADGNPKSTWLITRETARAVVAQADRAAELEAALRETRKHLRPDVGGRFDQHAAVDAIDRALAGDGGGA